MAMHQGGEAQICRSYANADTPIMSHLVDPRSLCQGVNLSPEVLKAFRWRLGRTRLPVIEFASVSTWLTYALGANYFLLSSNMAIF
jgi:hypothetical protein